MDKPTKLDEALAKLQNVPETTDIEVCGTWIWITFDGKPSDEIRTQMKEIGCQWSRTKGKWYWRPEEARRYFSRGRTSMHSIRNMYGSQRIAEE